MRIIHVFPRYQQTLAVCIAMHNSSTKQILSEFFLAPTSANCFSSYILTLQITIKHLYSFLTSVTCIKVGLNIQYVSITTAPGVIFPVFPWFPHPNPCRDVMMKLKNGSSRIAGVAVIKPNSNPVEAFSPHTTCPNENTGGLHHQGAPVSTHAGVLKVP